MGWKVFRNKGNWCEADLAPAGRDGARPLREQQSRAVYGGAWSPRPTGATLVVRSKRADVGIGPYGEKGKPTQPPRPAAHSGASAARMGGRGGIAAEIILKGAINIEQSLSHGLWPCQLPLHKGAFGDGGCGLPRRPCGPPRNDNGFLSFRGQCAHWSWESVLFTMDGQRAAVPREWPPPTKFRAEIWGVGQVVVSYGTAGDAPQCRGHSSAVRWG